MSQMREPQYWFQPDPARSMQVGGCSDTVDFHKRIEEMLSGGDKARIADLERRVRELEDRLKCAPQSRS